MSKELEEFRKSISVESGQKIKMSFREKIFRILTVPFFLLGLVWYWIHRAFRSGSEWEKDEMTKYKMNEVKKSLLTDQEKKEMLEKRGAIWK